MTTVPVGQTRKHSFLESLVNVAVGYAVALLTQIAVFPMFGVHADFKQNVGIGAIFTVVSIVRSYALRRAFNWAQIAKGDAN